MKKENKKRNDNSQKRDYVSGKGYCGLRNSKDRYSTYCEENDSGFYPSNNINLGSHLSSSNLSEIEKQKIRNYVIDLLGNDPINCFKDIIYDDRFGSLRTISERLGISRPTLRAYISTWLEIIYGKKVVDDIIKLFWPESSAEQRKKIRFYEIIENYIRLYPERTSLIPTRNRLLNTKLCRILSKNTFKPWVIDYLIQTKCYSLEESHAIYDAIWGKQCAKRRKIEYEDIEDFVHQRSYGKAYVLTPKVIFESMSEYPTDRYINISCGEGHKFLIQVRKLIYDYNWCPHCNEHFCERMMRNYLSQFFNKEFEAQVSLKQACEIDREKVINRTIEINRIKYKIRVFAGQLRYDHFCPNVCIVGNNGDNYEFAIGGEYDGIHHDEEDLEKNPFCNNMRDFAIINARDSVKNEVSYEKKGILIRLKEKNGFDRRKLLNNQKEVIQEIIQQFNKQIKEIFGFNDVRMKYDPFIRFDPLGEDEPYRIKGSLDDFL
ncbi:MAG: hypothetical protein CEE42_11265 [Promethearchaeota archaeon Loki_b31]|nr:MAG: hypothetical protein CEE42_11265 [Candidatus Lokiarchaeota archaeon Loki_b31]